MGLFDRFGAGLKTLVTPDASGIAPLSMIGAGIRDIADPEAGGANFWNAWAMRRQGLQDAQARAKAQAAQDEHQQMLALAGQMKLTPEQLMMMRADPKTFAESLKDQAAPYTISAGQIRGQGGKTVQAAPDYQVMGDQLVETTPGVAPRAAFTRAPSIQEVETHRKNTADEQMDRNRLALDDFIRRGQLGVERGRLGVAQATEARESAGSAPPTNSAGVLEAIATELRKRGALR